MVLKTSPAQSSPTSQVILTTQEVDMEFIIMEEPSSIFHLLLQTMDMLDTVFIILMEEVSLLFHQL